MTTFSMTDRIALEMNAGEAILTLAQLGEAAAAGFARWRRMVETNAPEDEQEAVKVTAQILSRVHARLSAALYPECEWMDNSPCEMAVTGNGLNGRPYCAFHLQMFAEQVATIQAMSA